MSQAPPVEPETANAVHVQSLKLAVQASVVVVGLYGAARVLWPDHPDYPENFHDAPPWVQSRIRRIALMSVASVNEANEHEAQRHADIAFRRELDDAQELVLAADEDHSKFYLIQDAFRRLRERLLITKPASIAVSIYRTALQQKGRG